MVDAGRLFSAAWRVLPRVPGPVVRGAFDLGARLLHRLSLGGVRQLEANLSRVTGASGADLRRLSREGIRRYMRYYAEVFQLPRLTDAQILARVRTINAEPARMALEKSSVVGALAHVGNWDLAGAWCGQHFAPVVTVAEKLEPEELFTRFLEFREGLGMQIFAYERGTGLFGELVAAATSQKALMPLLADRDLTRDGVEVEVCGHPMRVAPGPAAISLAAGVPLIGVFIRHERLRGARRRAAGSPWGIVIEFTHPIAPGTGDHAATMMMQQWADLLSDFLRQYPTDWHMLQKCFSADLDAERLASAEVGAYGETQ